MAFKKTAISLIVVAIVTAVAFGVYLWFNFNARSNLVLVVPKNVSWFYHFQTSSIRKITSGERPANLDSLMKLIPGLPLFKHIHEPAQTGIRLHSDVVLFGNQYGTYLALSLASEEKFTAFIQSLPKAVFNGNLSTGSFCNFVKFKNSNLYAVYRHKALILFQPRDTSDNLRELEKGFAQVFSDKNQDPITNLPMVQNLYEAGCQVIFYVRQPKQIPSHGVILNHKVARIVSGKTGRKLQAKHALLLFKNAGLDKVPQLKTITTNRYLDLTFASAHTFLKNYNNE